MKIEKTTSFFGRLLWSWSVLFCSRRPMSRALALADHLDQLADQINEMDGYWACREDCWPHQEDEERRKGHYLLRYGKDNEGLSNDLVVMGDLGTTWEPWRAYPTEQRTEITGTDLEADLKTLTLDADDWYRSDEQD